MIYIFRYRKTANVLRVTTKTKGIRSHVQILPPESGIREPSFIKCEDVRSISTERLITRWGVIPSATLAEAEDCLRIIMCL